jgi:hypothetical protein
MNTTSVMPSMQMGPSSSDPCLTVALTMTSTPSNLLAALNKSTYVTE